MRLNLKLRKVLAATMLVATVGGVFPVATYAADYSEHWAKDSITKWIEKDVLTGYEDGSFKPNAAITRSQFASVVVRLFGLTDTVEAQAFKDVPVNKWYAEDVAKITSAGIMKGYEDGSFKPDSPITREEAAVILTRAYQLTAKESNLTFKDAASIANWAKADVTTLAAYGYVSGNQHNAFTPQASLTRAEAITMIDKMTQGFIHQPGSYTQDVEGNLIVNTTGVELKDMTIKGNLYLVEEGQVTLNNVQVLGQIIVRKEANQKPITLTGATVVVDGKEVKIPIENNTIKMTINPDEVLTVNGVTLKKGQVISTVRLHEKNQLEKVHIGLLGRIGADVKVDTDYQVTDLVAAVTNSDNQKLVFKILESFKNELSTQQYERAVEMVEDFIKKVENFSKNSQTLSVDTLLEQINYYQNKLQDPDVKNVMHKIEKALELLEIQVDQMGKENMHIQTGLILQTEQAGYRLDELKIDVTFE